MAPPRVLAMVLAGGAGNRLLPLTAERSKPAVPFGGRYRIVDFVLSNLVNSEIHSIYLLVQYKSQSLIEHVRRAWSISHLIAGHFVTVVPPQMRDGPDWFQSTADAVHQNLGLIDHHSPDVVAVFGSDHVYRMDINQMVRFHLERNADVTVAALPMPLEQCSAFGIIRPGPDGRVAEFREKPARPEPMPGDPGRALASMGNYIFSTDVLIDTLEAMRPCSEQDFGRDVLPRLLRTHRVYVYDLALNRVPGIKPYEDQPYWRDVGTIDAYFAAHMDMLGEEPRFEIFNPNWPIYSDNYLGPDTRIIDGEVRDSVLGAGSMIRGARINRSVIRREVVIEPDADIDECIIMDYTVIGRGAKLRRTIVDRYNNIPPGSAIGEERHPGRNQAAASPPPITIVPKGKRGSGLVY
ncbi:glucose-1-phosphate adenylyltransferase [Methylocaldum marinum]|uniref:Glucose-1-phosphate adenylyltransferase n=1 Tax=Methylocaldum marinum TaxID=1432792 RepID=A0A250KYS9_9GAMM|nr:glucose-1-phosphate adenylyltransferase [Methylocaldum marinum]BBA36767.1 glucose-1-phosphate adenylyltransferase [Methylocaldum marinum]